jgi:hypothetical protein
MYHQCWQRVTARITRQGNLKNFETGTELIGNIYNIIYSKQAFAFTVCLDPLQFILSDYDVP